MKGIRGESPRKTAAKREWGRFVAANEPVIAATGIPTTIFDSIAHFDDFLSHGHLDHHADASEFSVDSLNSSQYEALVTLAESCFAAGYEWLSPLALRPIDRERLGKRFAE